MEPQPPRMSKEEKRLAWAWQQEGRMQAEIVKLFVAQQGECIEALQRSGRFGEKIVVRGL